MDVLTRIVFKIGFLVIFVLGNPACTQSEFPDIIFHFHGPEAGSGAGRSITGLGDINNDGFTDIAVSCFDPRGVYIFYGGDPPDSIPDQFIPNHASLGQPIDLNGDGIIELLTNDYVDDYCGEGTNGGIIYFHSIIDGVIDSLPFDSLAPDSLCRVFGFYFETGYVDEDPYGDIMSFFQASPPGEELVLFKGNLLDDKTSDWSFIINDYLYQYYYYDFDFIDFNGDGNLDIALGLEELKDTVSYIYFFYGPDFGSEPSLIIEEPEFIQQAVPGPITIFPYYNVRNIGDFNGDNWDDLGIQYIFEGHPGTLIYFGGPTTDSLYDYRMENGTTFISKAGDLNGDGYNDIARGGIDGYSSYFYIYAGGPYTDDQPDATVYRDDLPPVFLTFIGYRLAPIGDFNGDGLDDLLFSCKNFHESHGDVFVLAGSRLIPSAVNDNTPDQMPSEIKLEQNIPNPFNSGTVIKFTLPRSGYTALSIYNLLGEKVVDLVNRDLQAGGHKIAWDGNGNNGNSVASGIYFYRITSGDYSQTKKMVLLK